MHVHVHMHTHTHMHTQPPMCTYYHGHHCNKHCTVCVTDDVYIQEVLGLVCGRTVCTRIHPFTQFCPSACYLFWLLHLLLSTCAQHVLRSRCTQYVVFVYKVV